MPDLKMVDVLRSLQGGSFTCWLDRAARWLVAAVFVYAGLPKITDPVLFSQIIGAYGLLPEIFLLPAAVLLPMAELAAAILLLCGRREGVWLAAAMLLLFIAVLSYGIYSGLDIDCGCFGPEDPEHLAFSGLRTALLRDLLFCIPVLYCLLYHHKITTEFHGEKQ